MSVMIRYLVGGIVAATLVACAPPVAPGQGAITSSEPAAPKVLTLVGREGLIPDLPGQEAARRSPAGRLSTTS